MPVKVLPPETFGVVGEREAVQERRLAVVRPGQAVAAERIGQRPGNPDLQAAYAVAVRAATELLTSGTYGSVADGIAYDAMNDAVTERSPGVADEFISGGGPGADGGQE